MSDSGLGNQRPGLLSVRRVVLGLIILLAIFVLKTMRDAGQFKSIQPHFSGTTRTIGGVIGGEDITIDHVLKQAFISADDRFARLTGRRDALGAIYLLNLNEPDAEPLLLKRDPDEPIAPHGISLVAGTDGQRYLYVVDHWNNHSSAKPSHRILLYQVGSNLQLTLIQTFSDNQFLISPNDVVGVDERRFYFTNDHGSTSGLGRKLEEYLQLSRSNVVYYDGQNYGIVASGIAMANGINMSQDGNEVYVAATIGQHILVFDRNHEDGSLSKRLKIDLNTGVDNIERDEHDNLWVGCHPKLLTFVQHSQDTSRPSPSQIYKLSRSSTGGFQSEEIFLDDGKRISGSAVAAVSGRALIIGPVLDSKLLWCELPNN